MELLGCIVSLMLILSNASVILKQVMRDHKGNKARFGARKAISKMVTEDLLHVFLLLCFSPVQIYLREKATNVHCSLEVS